MELSTRSSKRNNYLLNECRTLVDLLAPDQPLPLVLSTRWPNTHNNSNNNKSVRRLQVPCALGKSTLTTEMCRYGESLDCFVSLIQSYVVSVILSSGNSRNERDVRKGKFYLWICGCPCTQTLIVVIVLYSSQVVEPLANPITYPLSTPLNPTQTKGWANIKTTGRHSIFDLTCAPYLGLFLSTDHEKANREPHVRFYWVLFVGLLQILSLGWFEFEHTLTNQTWCYYMHYRPVHTLGLYNLCNMVHNTNVSKSFSILCL